MNIKKSNVFIYPLDKVIFPYHEYTFSINSNLYERKLPLTQHKRTIIWLDSSQNLLTSRRRTTRLRKLMESHAMECYLKFINQKLLATELPRNQKYTNLISTGLLLHVFASALWRKFKPALNMKPILLPVLRSSLTIFLNKLRCKFKRKSYLWA